MPQDLEGIISRLEPVLGASDPARPPVALGGGITNRNYRLKLGYGEYVIRFPGKETDLLGISREAERIACETAAKLGIGPAVAAVDEEGLVMAFVEASPLNPEQLRAGVGGIESVAKALRAFHDSGVTLPVRFWVPDLLDDYARVVRVRGGELPPEYAPTRALARRIEQALPLRDPVPCHDDLLAGNLMLTAGGAMIVDWEYAGMGHRMFDLGNLAVNNDFDEDAEQRLLNAYFDATPTPAQHAGLQLMRIMSDAREAAWGVIQGVISELDFDFAAYAEKHFRRLERSAGAVQEWLDAATA
ncbi:MAG: phosphotransferase [Solirubrobacteraceae bacterium]